MSEDPIIRLPLKEVLRKATELESLRGQLNTMCANI
jgi:hypothetical protein